MRYLLVDASLLPLLSILAYGLLTISLFIALNRLLRAGMNKRRRWRLPRIKQVLQYKKAPPLVIKCMLIRPMSDAFKERAQLLAGCGIAVHALFYELIRRGVLCGLVCFILVWGLLVRLSVLQPNWTRVEVFLGIAVMISIILLLCDKTILISIKARRSQRIIQEIYAVSNQLLYYSGSKMNLHTKLSRCMPYTKWIRKDFRHMLNSWYHDSEDALQAFKLRIGTDEGYSFAETINSLRLNEHNTYYELLRQRIMDYKEKLELQKESKKETISYVLFTLASVPILFTFRVFIYPWFMEGQKLFHSLN